MQKRKTLLVTGITAVVLVILILSVTVVLENYVEKELQHRQIGTYQIKSKKADVNILLRQITLRDIIVEDSAANQRFTIPAVKASGIHILPFVFDDEMIINKLMAEQPEITVIDKKSDKKTRQQEEIALDQDREIKRIRIKQFKVADASFLTQKQDSVDKDTLFFIQAGIEIRNLNIFSDKQQLEFNNHSIEQLELLFTNCTYKIPGGLYRLQFDSLNYSTKQESLNLRNIHLTSVHPKYAIAKQTGVETDWYNIVLEHLNLEGINTSLLLKDTAIVFRSALLNGLNAKIFRDKRPPFPDKSDSKLPIEMLNSLPLQLYTDSILIKNGNIEYEEHGEESSNPGKVTFNQLYASVYNLGNIQDSIKGQTAMAVRAMVMNEALLEAEFIFPNDKYSHQYQVSGNMEPVKMTAFNPMLIPSAFVKVEEGQIKQLSFDFNYDNNKSEGSLVLQYENLNISLLDKEDGSQKTIKTFLTETFVLQKDNLKRDNSYQKGTISFEREKKKSIFNYWWKSIFSGIKDILAF